MNRFWNRIVPTLALFSLLSLTTRLWAQSPEIDHSQHEAQGLHPKTQPAIGPLDQLETALKKNSSKTVEAKKTQIPATAQNTMQPTASMNPPQKSNQAMGGGMMSMMDQMKGMMGQMMGSQMPNSQTPSQAGSELPGFPGASHIYHIGATGFFIDHSKLANFSVDQLTSLNKIKEKSLLNQSSLAEKIKQASGELWMLTASDQPNIKTIEIKVKEIESLKSNQRISFIRDIGRAASLLTPQQRALLLGTKSAKSMRSDTETMKPDPQAVPSEKSDPSQSQPMGDM